MAIVRTRFGRGLDPPPAGVRALVLAAEPGGKFF
jgi:hypothetical protein